MNKILIVGNCGSGKTTLSKLISEKLNLSLIHLDYHYWRSNWKKPETEEWLTTVKELVKKESWVMDGNYRSSLDIRIPAADTIVFLDVPKHVSLFRVCKRYFKNKGKVRPDIGGNNVDKIDLAFILWILRYPRKHIIEKIQTHRTNQHFIHLKNKHDIDNFVKSLTLKD